MPNPARCRSGPRRFLAFLWILALANSRAPELAARGSHAPAVASPVAAAADPHHHHHDTPDRNSDHPAWVAASPDHCGHCADGNACHESPGSAPGCSALLSGSPTIGVVAVERLREGWVPDRPLAENPTPPTPPPPSVL
jgi:hypothetical protein